MYLGARLASNMPTIQIPKWPSISPTNSPSTQAGHDTPTGRTGAEHTLPLTFHLGESPPVFPRTLMGGVGLALSNGQQINTLKRSTGADSGPECKWLGNPDASSQRSKKRHKSTFSVSDFEPNSSVSTRKAYSAGFDVASLSSAYSEVRLRSLSNIRTMLRLPENLTPVLEAGTLEELLRLLSQPMRSVSREEKIQAIEIISSLVISSKSNDTVLLSKVLPVFMDLLSSEQSDVTVATIQGLGRFSTLKGGCKLIVDAEAIPLLIGLLKSRYFKIREAVVNCIRISTLIDFAKTHVAHKDIADAIWLLVELLPTADTRNKFGIFQCLGELIEYDALDEAMVGANVIPLLTNCLSDRSDVTRSAAIQFLGRLARSEKAQQAMMKAKTFEAFTEVLLSDGLNWEESSHIVRTLGRLAKNIETHGTLIEEPAISKFLELISDNRPEIQDSAISVLAALAIHPKMRQAMVDMGGVCLIEPKVLYGYFKPENRRENFQLALERLQRNPSPNETISAVMPVAAVATGD